MAKKSVLAKNNKLRNCYLAAGGFLVAFVLGLTLLAHIFNSKSGFDILCEHLSSGSRAGSNLVAVADTPELVVEPFLYEYFTPPSNSFGMGETTFKSVNWSFFKQLFNAHTDWMLEYDIGSGWTNGNQYLDVSKTWVDELGGWKINLTFTNPSSMNVKARFTFACDLSVLDYVERDGTMVHLNYTIPGTSEFYSVFFNWSDLKQYPGLWFNKGVSDGLFWFRFGHDNIPPGVYVFDPTFGYTGTDDEQKIQSTYYNYILGTYASPSSTGNADSITVRFKSLHETESFQCALYTYVDHSSDYIGNKIAVTEEKVVSSAPSDVTFDFSDPKPEVVDGTNYYICCRICNGEDDGIDTIYAINNGGTGCFKGHVDEINFDATITYEDGDVDSYAMYCSYSDGGSPWSNVCPVASGEHPTNGSSGVAFHPVVGGTISDGNSNHTMNVTFATNVSGDWVNKQTNSSVGNNTGVNWTFTQANVGSTKYWWRVYVHDGICNQSFTFSFTTAANETPASWQEIQNWNGSIYNSSGYLNINLWNGSIYNTSILTSVNLYNGSIYNNSILTTINLFNGSIFNSSDYLSISLWNGSVYNTSSFYLKQEFNGSIYNSSSFVLIQNWNGSIFNNSDYLNINLYNGSIYNTSILTSVNLWNGSIYNLTVKSWQQINLWNGSIYNLTVATIINVFNGSIYNLSTDFIIISGVYPYNNTFNIPLQPVVYATINHTQGLTMNISWYYGLSEGNENILLGSDNNIGNSTQDQLFTSATARARQYYWRIQANDGTHFVNETFKFRTEGYPGGSGVGIISSNIYGIIGVIFGLMGIIAFILVILVKRKNKQEDEYSYYSQDNRRYR